MFQTYSRVENTSAVAAMCVRGRVTVVCVGRVPGLGPGRVRAKKRVGGDNYSGQNRN